jgi:hypothetical protein
MVRLCTYRNGTADPAEITAEPPGPDQPPAGAPCRHCGRCPVSRPRGLCYACSAEPAVRALYPVTSKFAWRGHGTGHGGYRLPEPTGALPGAPEKVAVLAERARLRQCLWHPDDAK